MPVYLPQLPGGSLKPGFGSVLLTSVSPAPTTEAGTAMGTE